jgi:mono/diheme cytochrome c family protein
MHAGAQMAKGKSLYERHCLACHGVSGKGDGPTGKLVIPPAADLTSPESSKKTDAEWLSIIENGKPGTAMMGFKGQLSKADLQELVAYIRSFSK